VAPKTSGSFSSAFSKDFDIVGRSLERLSTADPKDVLQIAAAQTQLLDAYYGAVL
jgi:hypothetical protein